MLIRQADIDDKYDLLEWRNHPKTRAMFFEQTIVAPEEHDDWFHKVIASNDQFLFVGVEQSDKIGVVRVDFNRNQNTAEISININPDFRGAGYSKILLASAILSFLENHSATLVAKVKRENIPSLKLFRGLGFSDRSEDDQVIMLSLEFTPPTFCPVTLDDAETLYSLLKQRQHSISHDQMPSFEDHCEFVKNNPYRDWFLARRKSVLGNFYTQDDNSIGVNLLEPKILDVLSILNYIRGELKPLKGKPSKIPPYFYFNVAYSNLEMQKILEDLRLKPLQITYQI